MLLLLTGFDMLTDVEVNHFRALVWQFYAQYKRSFAWRNSNNPYHIMVSEIMLQQTQTDRVITKFDQFIDAFPTVAFLAQADLRDVLGVWQGLGYNRRGKALWENAQRIMQDFSGTIPADPAVLSTFAHIGPNTAASIAAFAYNKPVIFIETNIRAVYLHSFFKHQNDIHDKQLMPLIAQTLDQTDPRQWYYALMDYGVYLKKTFANPSRASAHYAAQSKFEGSDRQIRGRIIKQLTLGSFDKQQLFVYLGKEHERYEKIIQGLLADGLIKVTNDVVSI